MINDIEEMLNNDVEANKEIGKFGALVIIDGLFTGVPEDGSVRILTHCNTGSLATAGYGTALGVIRSLHASGQLGKYSLFSRKYYLGRIIKL